jgi:glycogen debranching enzyme
MEIERERPAKPHMPKTILQVADRYYVLATSVLADHETRVLKQGETFAIFDSYGDIQPVTHAESGIFHRGTRYLSRFELVMGADERPLLLNSTLRDDNGVLKVDMTNRDFTLEGVGFVAKGSLYIHREKFLLNSRCLEQVEISNYSSNDIKIDMAYRVEADFVDIFEVRGTKRKARGHLSPVRREDSRMVFTYDGLDGIKRIMCFCLKGAKFEVDDGMLRFQLIVPSRGRVAFEAITSYHEDSEKVDDSDFCEGLAHIKFDHEAGRADFASIRSSNDQFNLWLRRSTDDLVMMTTKTDAGTLYPYAGIPWYCAPFGRDGIITALECLWVNPDLARGVLEYLSFTQADKHEPDRDSTPGKIIHEVRSGEMANLKEIPFGRYYGSVDSTPLFIGLAGEYFERTNDLALIKKIWPAIEKALTWIDVYGDADGDGFIEYQRENPNGLMQQGWKDSVDSIFHADGRDARGPIALCEVQAYVYWAYVRAAELAEALGLNEEATKRREKAAELKEKFDKSFWLEELGTYALALDGDKKTCRVASSNAGQCLFTGIVKPERARPLVESLMGTEGFSGWGIRTIGTTASRYNPMSYHNGSVWPHDCALIAWGMAKYGFKDEVERVFNGLFRAANYMETFRMPEVFCGFERREGEAPTLYPHACSPQAWSAASVYMLVQALLGLKIDARTSRVTFYYPRLPDSIESMKLGTLKVTDTISLDLIVQNYHSDVSVQLAKRVSGVSVVVEK